MTTIEVVRTFDATPKALWACVRAFGDVPWIGGGPLEVRGEGVGQVRIFERPSGLLHEQLTSLDDATRTLTYAIPVGMPFPASTYESTMTVAGDRGRGRLSWSGRFEPEEGASAAAISEQIQRGYGAVMDRLAEHLKGLA